jgi:uncharacterized membrane protein
MMTKKTRFAAVAVFLAVFVFLLAGEGVAGNKMKFTINNKTARKVHVAVAFNPGASVIIKGWYGVDAGKSKTITLDNFNGTDWFGFYAKNVPNKGEKRKVWTDSRNKFPVHPTKPFTNSIAQGGGLDSILYGSVNVGFRKLNFKQNAGTDTCTLNIK